MAITIRRPGYLRFWRAFTISAAWADAFGWASIVAGALVFQFGVTLPNATVWQGLWIAAIGFALALLVNGLVFAQIRAWYATRPLILSIYDGLSKTTISTDNFKTNEIAVRLRNRSEVAVVDCALYVISAGNAAAAAFPQLVGRFDVPPLVDRYVPIAQWIARARPHTDDPFITLVTPPSDGLGGGGAMLPLTGVHRVELLVKAVDCPDTVLACWVWLDGKGFGQRLSAQIV